MPRKVWHFYIDEKPVAVAAGERLIIACVAVPVEAWERLDSKQRNLQEPVAADRLSRIASTLIAAGGIGVIYHADLPSTLAPAGRDYDTTDIPRMAARDTAWSIALAQGVTATLRYLERSQQLVTEVMVLHDAKSLTSNHQCALGSLLTSDVPALIQLAAEEGLSDVGFLPRILETRGVPKAGCGPVETMVQAGVAVAHRLCQLATVLIDGARVPPCIYVRDGTDYVVSSLTKIQEQSGTQAP